MGQTPSRDLALGVIASIAVVAYLARSERRSEAKAAPRQPRIRHPRRHVAHSQEGPIDGSRAGEQQPPSQLASTQEGQHLNSSLAPTSIDPSWVPFVDSNGDAPQSPAADRQRVTVISSNTTAADSRQEFASQMVLRAVNSQGGMSSAVHYGGGWVISTSDGFPSIDHLIGGTFSRPKLGENSGTEVFTVTTDSRFFLVQGAEHALYPDLLFIELQGLRGPAVTFRGFSGLGVAHEGDDDLCVYSHWRDQHGTSQLHCSTGNLTSAPAGQRTDASSMLWHDAPTRPGASGGLLVSRSGTFLGVCLGGNPLDARQNVALRYDTGVAAGGIGFRGIRPYANNLITPISSLAILDRLESNPLIDQTNSDHDESSATPELSEQCQEISLELAGLCLTHGIPSLSVQSPSGVVFEVRMLDPSQCFSSLNQQSWIPFVSRAPKPAEFTRWTGCEHEEDRLDEVEVIASLSNAAGDSVVSLSPIPSPKRTGGTKNLPDSARHFGIRIRYSGRTKPVFHCHVDATGCITHF